MSAMALPPTALSSWAKFKAKEKVHLKLVNLNALPSLPLHRKDEKFKPWREIFKISKKESTSYEVKEREKESWISFRFSQTTLVSFEFFLIDEAMKEQKAKVVATGPSRGSEAQSRAQGASGAGCGGRCRRPSGPGTTGRWAGP